MKDPTLIYQSLQALGALVSAGATLFSLWRSLRPRRIKVRRRVVLMEREGRLAA